MPDGFRERHDLEQYFFTKNALDNIMNAFLMSVDEPEDLEKKLCLVCAPTLAKAFYEQHGLKITVLDIDTRFDNLPGFRKWDLRYPEEQPEDFEIVFIDPPFFYISLEVMSAAMQVL